jgi:hypothetical protein
VALLPPSGEKPVNQDLEVWLMFLPFWLLGTVAILAAVWHGLRFVVVHARAHAAGHVPKFSLTRRLQWHELTDDGRHHLKRAFLSFFIFFGLTALGIACVAAWAFWRHG